MSKQTAKGRRSRTLTSLNQQPPNALVPQTAPMFISHHLKHAREYPLYGCWVIKNWQEAGLTPVVIARQQEFRRIVFGVYLVDYYCLGIKNSFARTDCSFSKFERELPVLCSGEPEPRSVEFAHEMIYGALEYADKLGFQPHPDYYQMGANLILDPPDAHPRMDHIAFGHHGKPLYITGPNDTEAMISFVIRTLTRTCGEGNFDYLVGIGGSGDMND